MFEPIHGFMALYFITVLGLRRFSLDKEIRKKKERRKEERNELEETPRYGKERI